MSSSTPSRRAAVSHSAAPGADVNSTASTSPAAVATTERRDGRGIRRRTPAVDGEAHDIGAVRARRARRGRRRPSRGAARRSRRPATPSARRYSPSSMDVSDSATQSAVSPACWIAPRALGPRATICARRERRVQVVEQPGFVGRLHPAAEADAGRRDHHVRAGRAMSSRVRGDQRVVVDVRHDRERRRVAHLRAVALERRGELDRATVDGDDDRAAVERGRQGGAGGGASTDGVTCQLGVRGAAARHGRRRRRR